MPNQAGFNPRATIHKQYWLNLILQHLIPSTQLASRNRVRMGLPSFPIALDMNCGPGAYNVSTNGGSTKIIDDQTLVIGEEKFTLGKDICWLRDGRLLVLGSPLVIADQIDWWQKSNGISMELVCVDHNLHTLTQCKDILIKQYPNVVCQFGNDQKQVVEALPSNAIGFSYWDFNGYNDLNTNLLEYHAKRHRQVDILITRACVDARRMDGARYPTLFIDDYLRATGKRRLYVRKYANWRWWSFGFASNWIDRPDEKLGLVDIESEEGKQLIEKFRGEA